MLVSEATLNEYFGKIFFCVVTWEEEAVHYGWWKLVVVESRVGST